MSALDLQTEPWVLLLGASLGWLALAVVVVRERRAAAQRSGAEHDTTAGQSDDAERQAAGHEKHLTGRVHQNVPKVDEFAVTTHRARVSGEGAGRG